MSTTQLLIFLFERIDNISQFIAGFYFLRCLDCCLERRKGKLLFFITWIVCSAIASFVIFPQDATNITGIFLLFLLLNLVLYHGKWIIKLSMILILLPISAALNLLVMDIFYRTRCPGKYNFFYIILLNCCYFLDCVLPTVPQKSNRDTEYVHHTRLVYDQHHLYCFFCRHFYLCIFFTGYHLVHLALYLCLHHYKCRKYPPCSLPS